MSQKDLLGGKGANLAEMVRIGLPVPPGFTIATTACREYLKTGQFPDGLRKEISDSLIALEKELGKTFGGVKNPLLVSVRSGAKFSMPGMMETARMASWMLIVMRWRARQCPTRWVCGRWR
jgi:pyruvate,orthophosphate dikinase